MAPVKFKTRFRPHEPHKFAFKTEGPSMTQQQFKAECDVNNILAKYRKTGLVTHLSKHQGQFGDFSNFEDYQTSLAKVMQAHDSFGMLPSEIRNRFQNDPGQLVAYLANPENNEEAYKLGLKIRPTPSEPSMQTQMENALDNHEKKKSSKSAKEQ